MGKSTAYALNICQQVLRQLMFALAAASQADLGKLGHLLAVAAIEPDLDASARVMLANLADGVDMIAGAGVRKQ